MERKLPTSTDVLIIIFFFAPLTKYYLVDVKYNG